MTRLFGVADDARTLIAGDVHFVYQNAFACKKRLRSVLMEENIVTLDAKPGFAGSPLVQQTITFMESGIQRVRLPKTFYLFGAAMFKECSGLRQITIPEGILKIAKCCFYGSALSQVEVPKSVLIIEDEAFHNCQNLRDVVFQEGSKLRSIGIQAFGGARIERFVAPGSLKEIGQGAFCQC